MEHPDYIPRSCAASSSCNSGTSIALPIQGPTRVYETANGNRDFYYCSGGDSYTSPSEVVGGIPEGASIVGTYGEPTVHAGTCGDHGWNHFSIIDPIEPGEFSPYASADGLETGTIHLDPCTVAWPCDTTNLQQQLEDALNSGLAPQLSQALDNRADPAHEVDPNVPETDNLNNHRCDVSTPAYENPDWAEEDPVSLKEPDPFVTTGRPSGATNAPDPYLRWGESEWQGGTWDNWDGYGYRHISAKHGWSEADRTATVNALALPFETDPQSATRMAYKGVEYTKNGAICQRKVIVSYNDVAPGKPLGIITSFGEYQGEAP
jgi:hypothetical protein